MNHRRVLAVAAVLFAFSSPAVSLEPLSCKMKAALVEASAKARDKGMSRSEVRKLLDQGDITAEELDAVLDVAYSPGMRHLTPVEIAAVAYKICRRVNQ